MPNLKDIKLRIKSIKNTEKITQAMKMVAAAKVKKAENAVKASRPYTEAIIAAFKKVYASNPSFSESDIKAKHAIENYPVLLSNREVSTVGILAISSNKGLAGAYNASIVRKTISRIKDLKEKGLNVKLFIIGQKGINGLKAFAKKEDIEIVETYTNMPAIPTAQSANVIVEDLAHSFVEGQIDRIEIITTKFKSMLSFVPEIWQVLPIKEDDTPKESSEEKMPQAEMIFEPSVEEVLQNIVPQYLSNSVYQACMEACASELASRMSAMSNATKNAEEMISTLTIDYNKARQASITQEILEVVSGANALEG